MQNFEFFKAKTLSDTAALPKAGKFLAGGTNLIDLMKLNVVNPVRVVDVNALPYSEIKEHSEGSVFIGSLVTNSAVAYDKKTAKYFPVLSQAILAGASAQLRNKATTAGNLLQRTRCVYFRDVSKACNKRAPGTGCSALEGHNRNLAVLGTSEACIANNPSDMNVAMMALGATIQISGKSAMRDIPIQDFYLLPGSTPHLETRLEDGEFITGVTLKPIPKGAKSLYVKLRDRQSYEFALASAAVIVNVTGGLISSIQIAMGGIGAIPWRCVEAEKFLIGKSPTKEIFKTAAELTLKNAKPQSQNGFKIELAKRCLTHALTQVTS